jgi:serine/threonine protein kinase
MHPLVSPDINDYNPGHGYTVIKYLGSGAWKSAFRGTSATLSQNIALLCYHSGSRTDAANDLRAIFRVIPSHEYFEYLAKVYAVVPGEDGRIWIAEELIPHSLKNVAPLADVTTFTRIARDLSRAVACIHENKFVHRDIKLDNCGVYKRFEKAKLFDLGSLISEPGAISCTILTRAPELLRGERGGYSYEADVWALGATLFALSTGDYPFISSAEVEERSELNEIVRFGKSRSARSQAKRRKKEMDAEVEQRALRADAERVLSRRIKSSFGPEVAGLLREMLRFDPQRRRITARQSAERWEALAANASRLAPPHASGSRWEGVAKVLEVVINGELTLTSKQLKRARTEWDEAKRRAKGLPKKAPPLDLLFMRASRAIEARK